MLSQAKNKLIKLGETTDYQLPFCLADPFLAAKISIMAMFDETSVSWLGHIILTILR